jgi:hypothetical protein
MAHGKPIRYTFVGSTGSTSQSLNLFHPGTNNQPYIFLPTDWLTLKTMNGTAVEAAGEVVILNAPAGATTVTASTLLLSFGAVDTATADWHEESVDAICGGQGILPSVLALGAASTAQIYLAGSGFIEHGPGTTPPGWMATQTPPGISTLGDTQY